MCDLAASTIPTARPTMTEPLRPDGPPRHDMPEPGIETVMRTLASPASIAQARWLTRAAMDNWGLADRADDAALTVSELAANAFQHGASPVLLELRRDTRARPPAVTCTVRDSGRWARPAADARAEAAANPNPDAELAEGGRGLAIIDALADALVVRCQPPGTSVTARFVARSAVARPDGVAGSAGCRNV